MSEQLYEVRMRRPNTLVIRRDDAQASIEILKQDEKGDNIIRHVNLATARDWVECGVAEAIDKLPPKETVKAAAK